MPPAGAPTAEGNASGVDPTVWSALLDTGDSSRRFYADGRVCEDDLTNVGAQGETQIFASRGVWRAAIDVSVGPTTILNFSAGAHGIVRVYARTGTTKALIKQGTFLGQDPVSRLVVSTRAVPCDEILVTARLGLFEANALPLSFSVAMYGFDLGQNLSDVTVTDEQGPLSLGTVSNLPAFLYGFYASLDGAAAGLNYLWFSEG